jgi:predicted metalloprotease with PDZ domain
LKNSNNKIAPAKGVRLTWSFKQMFKFLVTSISIISFSILATDRIKLGTSADVETDGFFSPTLSSYTIQKVKPNSPAENAGIIVGQKLISVEDCKIPGCPVSEAKKLMRKESGSVINLLLENLDGSKVSAKVMLSTW